jgi:hypothetical protein
MIPSSAPTMRTRLDGNASASTIPLTSGAAIRCQRKSPLPLLWISEIVAIFPALRRFEQANVFVQGLVLWGRHSGHAPSLPRERVADRAKSHIRTVLSTPPETTTGRPFSSATAPPRISPTGEAADCDLGLALRLFDTGLSLQLRAALPRIDPADVTAVGARSSARLSSLRTGMRQRWPACRDWNCPAGTSILARAHPMRRSGRPPRSPA